MSVIFEEYADMIGSTSRIALGGRRGNYYKAEPRITKNFIHNT